MTNDEALTLCRRWREHRDERAFAELYREYRPRAGWLTTRWRQPLHGLATLSEADFESAAGVAVWRAADSYDGTAPFGAWLEWKVRNELHRLAAYALRPSRLGRTVPMDAPGPAGGYPLADTLPAPAQSVGASDDLAAVLDRLSEQDRTLLEAVYLHHTPHTELARARGVSGSWIGYQVKRALHRARRWADT